jgi:DNA-binding LytR/AlgR family response regulator
MRIAIIEDDHVQMESLSGLVRGELASHGHLGGKIDTFESGEAFLSSWRAGVYDLVILDIFMDKLTGIETARRIREADQAVRLVFCTTSNEFASESYEVDARYYILKPVTQEGVSAMFRRLDMEAMELAKTVVLPDGRPILVRHVLYTDYFNHVVTVYLKGEEPRRVRTSQMEMERLLLPCGCFFSPVRGILINFHEVAKMTEEGFILSNGKFIHITRRKYREAKDAYTRFRFEKMRREVER